MAETNYFAGRMSHGSTGQTGELAEKAQKICPRQLVQGIRLATAIIVGSSVKRLQRRERSYKFLLPEVPVITEVEYQDKRANQHYYAIHCSPNFRWLKDSIFMTFAANYVK